LHIAVACGDQAAFPIANQAKRNLRVRECNALCVGNHIRRFRCIFFQEFHPCGNIVKQLLNHNGRAVWAACVLHGFDNTALAVKQRADGILFAFCHHAQFGNGTDCSKSFAAKAERENSAQILGGMNFAGCMAAQGERRVLA